MVSKLGESESARELFFSELVSLLFDDALKADLAFKSFLMQRGVAT